MDTIINDLYKMCETLGESLKEANEKIRNAGGKLSAGDMQYVDQLTHAIKSIKTTIAMMEAEDEGGSYDDGGSYRRGGYSRGYGPNRGSYDGGSYEGGSYEGGSYARGRGRNARRDSMGRYSNRSYSREGYSRDGGDMAEELRGLMEQAPDEQIRQEMQRLVQKLEQR